MRSDLGSIRRQSEIRIRTKECRDLLRLRLVDPNLARSQGRIRGPEFVSNLLPGQCFLGETTFCQNCGRKQPNAQTTKETFHETSPDFLGSD